MQIKQTTINIIIFTLLAVLFILQGTSTHMWKAQVRLDDTFQKTLLNHQEAILSTGNLVLTMDSILLNQVDTSHSKIP